VDALELNRLVEKAKAEATATGAVDAPNRDLTSEKLGSVQKGIQDSDIERLSGWLENLADEADRSEEIKKEAEAERCRHLNIAKLLTALDTLMEVGR
jgi:hypothetical protein